MDNQLNEMYEQARSADKDYKRMRPVPHVNEAIPESDMSTRLVEVNVYGPNGMLVEAEKVNVSYEIMINWRSWGIDSIDMIPRGVVEVFMSMDPDDITGDWQQEFSVKIDLSDENVETEYMRGQAYIADSLDITLNEELKPVKVIFSCFAIDK